MGIFIILLTFFLVANTFYITEWLLQHLPHPLSWALSDDRQALGGGNLAALDFEYGHHVLVAGAFYVALPVILMIALLLAFMCQRLRNDQ